MVAGDQVGSVMLRGYDGWSRPGPRHPPRDAQSGEGPRAGPGVQAPVGSPPMTQPRKPRVAIVFGGRSSEHAISCVTAGSVLDAIDRTAYDVIPIGIAADGRWVLESGDSERLRITGPDQLPSVDGERASIALLRETDGTDL